MTNMAVGDWACPSCGDLVEIHAEHCKGHEKPYPPYSVVGCTCTPLVFRTGAKA